MIGSKSTWRVALALAALGVGCSGDDEVHDCDAGTPTCESSLVVNLQDQRTAFMLTVSDGAGFDATITCPDAATGTANVVEGYTITCGSGRVTIETGASFGEEVTVQLEQNPPRTVTVDYQLGSDFCGNPCTIGSIQL